MKIRERYCRLPFQIGKSNLFISFCDLVGTIKRKIERVNLREVPWKLPLIGILLFNFFSCSLVFAQAGMTVSPGRIYYKIQPGGTASQKVVVSNPSSRTLEVVASLIDWKYDSLGNNQTLPSGSLETSASSWVRVMPGSYFSLEPNEKRELEIVLTVPNDADVNVPVHTSLLFLTQINPADAESANGALIKVSVRMGVKIYHSFAENEERDIEVLNFVDILPNPDENEDNGALELTIRNTGKIWLEGTVKWEILNTKTGKKFKLPDQDLYSLPDDTRKIRQKLPPKLNEGNYIATAIINYGDKDEFNLVELEFIHL